MTQTNNQNTNPIINTPASQTNQNPGNTTPIVQPAQNFTNQAASVQTNAIPSQQSTPIIQNTVPQQPVPPQMIQAAPGFGQGQRVQPVQKPMQQATNMMPNNNISQPSVSTPNNTTGTLTPPIINNTPTQSTPSQLPPVQTPAQNIPQQINQIPVQPKQTTIPTPPPIPTPPRVQPLQGQPTPMPTATLQAGPRPNNPRKPQIQNTQKRGSKLSMKGFLIGCFIFFVILFGGIGAALYYILQNPERVGGAVDIATIEQGLRIFSVLFFAFLFFLGFGMLVINAYRLATVKEGGKVKFALGLFFSFLILGGALGGGIVVLQSINQIAGSNQDTTNIIRTKVPTAPTPRYLHSSPGLQLIAPISLTFELNRTAFERNLINTIGTNQVLRVVLDCGNQQQLIADLNSLQFGGSCLFEQKGNYPAQLIVTHSDLNNTIQQETVLNAGTLGVSSAIDITTSLGAYTLNDNKTEINVGKAPAKVLVDASNVFEDYGIQEYKIDWDLEGDGERDKKDDVAFSHNYKKPGINNLLYTIPALGDYVYSVSFRVGQSDVPICEVQPQIIQDTTYNFRVVCDEPTTSIVEYNFDIVEFAKDRSAHKEKTTRPSLRHSFLEGGEYIVKLTYITNEGKKGQFESNVFSVGTVMHDIGYSVSYKGIDNNKFSQVPTDQEDSVVTWNDGTLIIRELPVELEVLIDNIVPLTQNTNTQVLFNDRPILSNDNKRFNTTVTDQQEQNISIVVTEGTDTEGQTTVVIPIQIQQSSVLGQLTAIGGTVGFDPFEVRLDASTTSLTDPEDEIIYFTWDFGDGVVKKNTSQGTIKHTYIYDVATENGEYKPSVTIKTKKGIEETIELENPILVKKRSIKATIRTDSHLSQIAGVGEIISLTLATDGDPQKIIWNFGDGNTFECEGRSCLETSVSYDTIGQYRVKANVTYTNGNETETNGLKFIVEE